MLAISNSLYAHNFEIFQPILMTLVSKFMVHRALSGKKILIIRVAVPFKKETTCYQLNMVTIFMFRQAKEIMVLIQYA